MKYRTLSCLSALSTMFVTILLFLFTNRAHYQLLSYYSEHPLHCRVHIDDMRSYMTGVD